jgi:hypothetical protein
MAIGVVAPWMLAGLAREPGFAASRKFVTWNALGIVDLIVAVTVGAAVPLLFPNVVGAIPTSAMTRIPLVLIPGFFVPGYIILHVIALAQSRRAASTPRLLQIVDGQSGNDRADLHSVLRCRHDSLLLFRRGRSSAG